MCLFSLFPPVAHAEAVAELRRWKLGGVRKRGDIP